MRKIILVLINLIIWISLFSQEKNSNSVGLNIENFSIYNDSCTINLHVINKSHDTIVFYKPRIADICSSVLRVYAKSNNRDNQIYNLYPCEATKDLESIYVDQNNSICLLEHKSFDFELTFALENFSPHLESDTYFIYIEINFSIANLKSKQKYLYVSDIISNGYYFEYFQSK
jgi:hypothetical protein